MAARDTVARQPRVCLSIRFGPHKGMAPLVMRASRRSRRVAHPMAGRSVHANARTAEEGVTAGQPDRRPRRRVSRRGRRSVHTAQKGSVSDHT